MIIYGFARGQRVNRHEDSHTKTMNSLMLHNMLFESRWHFKNALKLVNLVALKFLPLNKLRIFQCIGKIFCVEFQRVPLKFHTKYLTHTLKDAIFIRAENLRSLKFKSSYKFLKRPLSPLPHPDLMSTSPPSCMMKAPSGWCIRIKNRCRPALQTGGILVTSWNF